VIAVLALGLEGLALFAARELVGRLPVHLPDCGFVEEREISMKWEKVRDGETVVKRG